ncbi:SusC/RagA family TonB-linked outer membrane protein [Bacteroides sp. 224]|uniref:SusC/RagA family TonB-linked outer membrane protein n=1 Tax=Bacteroides sp. 224 TaxID=2302936 RepID=UPI0013D2C9EB|nr:SusC/RagA family TonB-linked outer membrane protein [Bacteroides sp. 224]NDV64066.1 SusC/RagA family TonB-linked outer membrane protein [Bacteroides sp. 224]
MKKNYLFFQTRMQTTRWTKLCCLGLFLISTSMNAFAVPEKEAVEVAQQQTKTVKGSVVDESGEPIIGANVKALGTTLGTITDFDGKFNLSVPANQKIEVSFIGYTTQVVAIPASGEIKVTLKEDSKLLDEVVVVGYGTQRVKDLTGAASMVKMNEIADLPGASIIDALAGQIVGLSVSQSTGRPGAMGSFKVREPAPAFADGVSYGPLIVIDDVVQVNHDGEPDMTAFNMLDQSEIESMTVLKDASAAVYGSRSSQGVILIKTKRGSVGTPKISYSAKLDFSDAVSHAKTMNAYETGVFTNRMLRQFTAAGGTDYTPHSYSEAELNTMKGLDYNWLDRAWQSSVSHRHSLSVNGGTDKVTYFAGVSYQKQGSNLGDIQDYEKWTFRTGGELKVAAGLKLSASIAGYNAEKTSPNYQVKIAKGPWGNQSNENDYLQLRHMPRHIPMEVTTDEGTFFMSPYIGPHHVYDYKDDNSVSGYPLWNFFANEASKARKINEDNGYNANFSLTYDVPHVKGLSLKGSYSISYANTFSNDIGDYYQVALATNTATEGKHLVGEHSEWVYPQFGRVTDVNRGPAVIYNKRTTKSEQMNFMINYNRSFGQHDVALTGVVERAENEGKEMQTTWRSPLDSFNGTSEFAGTIQPGSSDTYVRKYESGALSYVGRLNYKYGNRYLAQFIIRADASTKFAPENYWGTFPTGSLGWVLSEEKFFQNSKVAKYIDFLKLRYSLGKTGKDNVKAWSWLYAFNTNSESGAQFGQNAGLPGAGAMFNGTANRKIKWDQTIKSNYGIDVNVLSNRLGLTVDYFYDKTTDMLMKIPEDPALVYIGAALPAQNYGAVDSWGWEFTLSWNDKINQNLLPKMGPVKYNISMNYGISWYKIKKGVKADFDYPSIVNDMSSWTGYRSPNSQYGFKTWNGTSQGDGILRNQADIDNYWAYLEQNAVSAGGEAGDARYFDKSKKDMHVGMLAYQDLAGSNIDYDNKTIQGPDGRIARSEDYAKLASNRRHNINTRLGAQWGDFSWSAQLSTSWGGYSTIYSDVKQDISTSSMIWSQFSYMNDMYDPTDNPNGKYPSMAVDNAYGEYSNFWTVSTFRCYVRNMTFSYALPKELTRKINIDKLQINLTGNNLWDFYNPYPKKFRNMYDNGNSGYPTLRTWTLGVNLTF